MIKPNEYSVFNNNIISFHSQHANNSKCCTRQLKFVICIGILILGCVSLELLFYINTKVHKNTESIEILTNNKDNSRSTCSISREILAQSYPNPLRDTVYLLAFNTSIMQAYYVAYIEPIDGNPCIGCNFRRDPYGINNLDSRDYENVSYNRGQLVPNAAYGRATYIISNAVPMVPRFDRGAWKISEEMVHKNYKNKLIVKGCDYSGYFVIGENNHKLYIPLGCYYTVFDTSDLWQYDGLTILDYGYYKNIINSVYERKLAPWIACGTTPKPTIAPNYTIGPTRIPTLKPTISPVSRHGVYMRSYTPGMYNLTPSDYGYADNIIVELWGAGGSSNSSLNINCGGSGAYIKASIPTNGITEFNIKVGQSQITNISCDGEESWLRNKKINLTVGGGFGFCSVCNSSCAFGGKILSMYGVSNVLYHTGNGAKQICHYYGRQGSLCDGDCAGGDAPYGGNGGQNMYPTYRPNGTSPGGGSGPGWPSVGTYGGNGAIIIYF